MEQHIEILNFKVGMRHGLPIALGYLSVSIAFGMIALDKGFAPVAPVVISMTSFTGTGQFVGIDLMSAGAAAGEILLTLLIINARYFLMSMSLSMRLAPEITLWQRFIIAFGNTDEIFAVAMNTGQRLSFRYLLGMIVMAYTGWVGGTAIGVAAQNFMPASVTSAFGILLYAMYIAIIVPPAVRSKPVLAVILIAVFLSCMLTVLPVLREMGSGWIIIVSGVAASLLGAFLFPLSPEQDESEGTP